MQFVPDGPDVPDLLLQAHEDGRVVFFCGAGISYPAGLPSFQGLVDSVYKKLGTLSDNSEKEAYGRFQFDAVLDLVERRVPGQRFALRSAIHSVLKPNLRKRGAKDTHKALLELSRTREGDVRLVTTNFDRVFEKTLRGWKPEVPTYPAPLLPIPKNSRWNGLVYLHGLLPEHPDAFSLNRLVVTSGDFGLAYLTERWAARFVGELFRNYVVCFVGYSINDPVLRYMMDALAADRMLGESAPQAYAFGDAQAGDEDAKQIEWRAKGVVPILYRVPTGTRDHSALHETLKHWAAVYRDGTQGKEQIVSQYAITKPSASTVQDDFVGRMLWALAHESGLPAKRFADFDPVPSLEWLDALNESRFVHLDLPRFGVTPTPKPDADLRFSFCSRPAPYRLASWMSLASVGWTGSRWDRVMVQIARWLMRHLNDPGLLHWVLKHGSGVGPELLQLIGQQIDGIEALQVRGNDEQLALIRNAAPNAIPDATMKALWRLLIARRIRTSTSPDNSIYIWRSSLRATGMTTAVRLELRRLLAPMLKVKKSFHFDAGDDAEAVENDNSSVIDTELVLASDFAYSAIRDLGESPEWLANIGPLLGDFEMLLNDALELLREVGEADAQADRSHWDMPSISPHWQNRGYRDWVVLIELVRDAWIQLWGENEQQARQALRGWWLRQFPTFKRLALFAAAQQRNEPDNRIWVDWLVGGDSWWLWSIETMREVMRLLVLRGGGLSDVELSDIVAAILRGPPRSMYRDDIADPDWVNIVDRMVWLRLAKLKSSGATLTDLGEERLRILSEMHPRWALVDDESDEFSHWMSGTGDPGFRFDEIMETAPRSPRQLRQWLLEVPSDVNDDWRDLCSRRFFLTSWALVSLAKEGIWKIEKWREALQVWGEEGHISRAWKHLSPTVLGFPQPIFTDLLHGIAWWVESASKSVGGSDPMFFPLIDRLLDSAEAAATDDDAPVTRALNHPAGLAAQALLNCWFNQHPNDNQGLDGENRRLFTEMCRRNTNAARNARVILASRLVALFRVDRIWTEEHLLPRFSWTDPDEASALWEGFLWAPRIYPALLRAQKREFLDTASHYADIGQHASQFSAFLTYVALQLDNTFSAEELASAFASLPPAGLVECAETLVSALEGAGEKREAYWKNRIQPFWHKVWPKSLRHVSGPLSVELAELAIAAGRSFPEALSLVLAWIRAPENLYSPIHKLQSTSILSEFPADSLALLDALVSTQMWAPAELKSCLESIISSQPELSRDARYLRLAEFVRVRYSG